MKNYIETKHYYVDEDGDENWDVLHAVRPTPSRCRFQGRDADTHGYSCWEISPGQAVTIQTKDDIAALRKLLDAIEEEITKESK